MLNNYFKISIRKFKNEKGYSFINIAGLAIGLAVFILAFLFVNFEFSFDKNHINSDNIYRIIFQQNLPDQTIHSAVSPAPAGPILKEIYPEVIEFTRFSRLFGDVLLSFENQRFYENGGSYADNSFFDMFSINFVQGDSKNALILPFSVVLTQSLSQKYFGNENPVGQTLKFENHWDLLVTGVIEDIPPNSHLQFDFLLPFILLKQWGADLDDWNNWGNEYTYLLLREGTDFSQFNQKLSAVLKKYQPESKDILYLQPLREIHLSTKEYDVYANLGDRQLIHIFILTATIILLISCINFINLTTARSLKRSKEVSLRKVVGANRSQLIKQFLGESFFFTIIAFLLAIFLVKLILPICNNLFDLQISLDLGDPFIIFGILTTLVLTALVAGSYPALFLSSFTPMAIIKGKTQSNVNRFNLRKALVVIQFTLSIILIIFTLVIQDQIEFMMNKDLGFDKENIIYAQMRGQIRQQYEALKERLLKNRNILSITAGSSFSTIYQKTTEDADWSGKNIHESRLICASIVDFDYINTFNIKLLQGRDFSKQFSTDRNEAFIINESASKMMEFENPVGQFLSFNGESGKIIGVVEDYHFLSLHQKIQPLIMSIRDQWREFIFIKVNSQNISESIDLIQQSWTDIAPNIPFEFKFWDETLNNEYRREQKMGELLRYLTFLAIIISCMGLFGLASFSAEQKTKEIGIRKVLGAKVSGIIFLLCKDFTTWIFFASLIAWPVAFIATKLWLQNFAYQIAINFTIFILSAVIALTIAMLTVSYQAIQAAMANPIDSIKYE